MTAHAAMLGEKIKSELAKLRPEYENNPTWGPPERKTRQRATP
jgi:hypothetical protein